MSPIKISFFDEPVNALAALKARKPELHFDYDEIMHETHTRVFTVAKITKIDLLNYIQASLEDAYKKGQSFEAWQENIKPVLAKKGWLGDVSVTNPQTGEVKQIYVGSRRLKRIFETNMRVSFARARYESQMSSPFEYFRYVAILDRRTRASHAKLHGLILPKTHKFWQKNYPPNDWGCRCKVQVVSEYEIKQKGYKISQSAPGSIASKDWAYNPGKSSESLEAVLDQKVANLSGVLKQIVKDDLQDYERQRNLYVWEKGLNDAIDEIIVKQNLQTPINMVQVGLLSDTLASMASKILGKDVNTGGIILTKKELTHASPKRKEAYNHAFRVEEMRKIVSVLSDENNAYVDIRDAHANIVFMFDDEKDKNKVNLIPIEISKIHKKFKQSNYIITLDKAEKADMEGLLKIKDIIKLK
nr:MAG TPA: minor capsid component [Caudoviricetes sp.]